ncbi:MAG TPA: LytTR family DNA-binding domain-containing protein [Terracidiphilus sp.]
MLIQTLLADDEVLARQKLRELLRKDSDIEIVGEAASGPEVLELVRATAPQVLFLDVRMPGMDGFEVVRELSASASIPMPHVIFSTAYDQYALRAFESRAVDYLLKPYTAERLRAAVDRAREQVLIAGHRSARNGIGEENGKGYPTRIVFKSRGRILFLRVAEIRWIGAEENYVRISTGTETHLLRETMTSIEEKLDPQMFLRVHRSAIVNLHFVKEVRTEAQCEFAVLLTNGQKVAMSRSYHSRVRSMLESA